MYTPVTTRVGQGCPASWGLFSQTLGYFTATPLALYTCNNLGRAGEALPPGVVQQNAKCSLGLWLGKREDHEPRWGWGWVFVLVGLGLRLGL